MVTASRFSINCTVGAEGLFSDLLVFGAVPSPARRTPVRSQLEGALLMDTVMEDVEKEYDRRKIAFRSMHNRRPKGLKRLEVFPKIPSGSEVIVYRQSNKSWEGPFKFTHVYGETLPLQINHGQRMFRSSSVKAAVAPL